MKQPICRWLRSLLTILMLIPLVNFVVRSQEMDIPRISPVPLEVEGLTSVSINLDGDWLFDLYYGPEFTGTQNLDHWSPITVPGEWAMQGFKVDSGGTAGYYRTFVVPDEWNGKQIKLRFNAVYSESVIYVNNQLAGSHHGGFTAFELDVTDLVNYGAPNRLLLMVKNESLENSLSSGSRYACHPLGGISRSVSLMALPKVNIRSLAIQTHFDKDYLDATLTALLEIGNEGELMAQGLKVVFELSPWQTDQKIPLSSNQIETGTIEPGSVKKLEYSVPVEAPAHWNCEAPNLYILTCHLLNGDQVLESIDQRFGFRQSEVKGNQLFINGKPVKLRGVNRHEVFLLTGRVVPPEMYRKDIE